MRICSSVGRVTVALPLWAIVPSSLLVAPKVLQHQVQLVEPLRPGPFEPADPVVDGLERLAVQPVETPRPWSRTWTAPTSRSTRRCLDTWGWARPSSPTRSLTAFSPPARASRSSRRRGSATALKASAVVATLAMRASYSYMGMYQPPTGAMRRLLCRLEPRLTGAL